MTRFTMSSLTVSWTSLMPSRNITERKRPQFTHVINRTMDALSYYFEEKSKIIHAQMA